MIVATITGLLSAIALPTRFPVAARGLGACFATALVSAGAFAQAGNYDIAGVKIGLPLSTQKAVIAKANPNYQMTDIKDNAGKVIGLEASVQNWDGELVDRFIALQGNSGKVWFIARAQDVASPESPKGMLGTTLLSALKEKYGVPTDVPSDREVWYFDRQDRKIPRGAQTGCSGSVFGAPLQISTKREIPDYVSYLGIRVPNEFSGDCGVVISAQASFGKGANGGANSVAAYKLVRVFRVQIADVKSRYDEMAAEKAAAQEAEQKRKVGKEDLEKAEQKLKEDLEKAGRVKPRL